MHSPLPEYVSSFFWAQKQLDIKFIVAAENVNSSTGTFLQWNSSSYYDEYEDPKLKTGL
jgi:hypothetical protein